MVPYLKDLKGLTVITNGAKTAVECAESLDAKIYCTGGLLRENSLSFIGETAKRSVDSYNTDILFFSCRALSVDKGLTDISEEEAELRSIMMKNTKKAVLLMDSSKFNTISFCNVGSMEKIDIIKVYWKLAPEKREIFMRHLVEFQEPSERSSGDQAIIANITAVPSPCR
jgi:DeoR/GlpR family transcriptional regulator of sugar metabolism